MDSTELFSSSHPASLLWAGHLLSVLLGLQLLPLQEGPPEARRTPVGCMEVSRV